MRLPETNNRQLLQEYSAIRDSHYFGCQLTLVIAAPKLRIKRLFQLLRNGPGYCSAADNARRAGACIVLLVHSMTNAQQNQSR